MWEILTIAGAAGLMEVGVVAVGGAAGFVARAAGGLAGS